MLDSCTFGVCVVSVVPLGLASEAHDVRDAGSDRYRFGSGAD